MKKVCIVMTVLCALLFACKPETEKPTVVTKSVEEVTENSAKVVGEVVTDGGAEVTERGTCYSTTQNPTVENDKTIDGDEVGAFTSNIPNLAPNTQYYVRAYATNEKGTSYGNELSFVTNELEGPEEPEDPEEPGDDDSEEPIIPTVTTFEVTDITISSAVSGGEIAVEGELEITARGVCWSVNQNPTTEDNLTNDGDGVGTFTSNIPNLAPNTQYYVRAYAIDENGNIFYGEEKSFVTLEKLLPSVKTSEVTEITETSAVCGGEVTFDGNTEVTARGVCWSITPNPTIEDNLTNDGDGVGTFTSNIPNLAPNTQYYVRAFATNEVGTNYGEEMSFTTEAEETTGTTNGYEWVDLGLPSGLKWASCNVGATSPEQYGDYYAWGETETKDSYDSNNCTTMYAEMDDISGNPQYDVARKKWGDAWRMPTYEEQEELLNNCTWEFTTLNGFNGYKVTGPNGNYIFLPAAGYRYGSTLNFDGYYGGYWSSKPYSEDGNDSAFFLCFDNKEQRINAYYRSDGQSVRAVIE